MRLTPETSPLGLPDVLQRETAIEWVARGRAMFNTVYGANRSLEEDLEACSLLFDPVAQGARLRRIIAELPPTPVETQGLPVEWLFSVSDGRWVLTPDGVAGIYALESTLISDSGEMLFLRGAATPAIRALLAQYRRWNQHRLRGVVGLLEGSDKPLQHQAIGALLALLVNDNVGPSRALTRADAQHPERRRVIDAAFFSAVSAFTQALAPGSKVKSGGNQLISGWYMGEIARRLGHAFVLTPVQADRPSTVYVQEDGVAAAIALIARDVGRGNRIRPSVEQLAAAYDALVAKFLENRETLARFGELHESPRVTNRRRDELLEAYAARVASEHDG